MTHAGISIIISTRNNCNSLSKLFESFIETNTVSPVEFILVDHGSTDKTFEILSRFATRVFIRVIKHSHKSTPGASRNTGAGKARFPYLLFMDSSINYSFDILPKALIKLKNPSIGAVGVRLEDDPESLPPGLSSCIRHTGIAFEPNSKNNHLQPVYTGSMNLQESNKITDGIFPAVTGAFMLCRKSDFEMLSGFCDKYSKSLEDIDFCLQLKARLNLDCWCFNEIPLLISNVMNRNQGDLVDSDNHYKTDQSLLNKRHGRSFYSFRARLKPRNILFVNYSSIDCNGGYHVQFYAHQLIASGFDCRVGVPGSNHHKLAYNALNGRVRNFEEILKIGPGFNDDRGPDIIHAWTPREVVRVFCDRLLRIYPCPVIIHLEDNEPYLTQVTVGREFTELEQLSEKELDKLIPESCYHPTKGRRFIDSARGLSLIIDTLSELNFKKVPSTILPAPVDDRLFYPRPLNLSLRKKLEIPEYHLVLVYTGNVHVVNRDEVLELYKAVRMLNDQGRPTTLIRTGTNAVPLCDESWATKHEKYLGFVERSMVPEILAAADILVQPGKPGAFNNQRVPSKLPEYFAIGRPIILPMANVGLMVEQSREAYVVLDASAQELIKGIIEIVDNLQLQQRLAAGAVSFYRTQLRNSHPEQLMNFYLKVQPQPIQTQYLN